MDDKLSQKEFIEGYVNHFKLAKARVYTNFVCR